MGQKRQIQGSRFLITGASSGIGRALAERAAREGAKVMMAARSIETLQQLAEQLRSEGADVAAVGADVTREEDRQRMIRETLARFGGLDVLVNNAGVGSRGLFENSTPDVLRRIMEVNFFALAETTRAALPALAQGNRPMIVNISSVAGRRGIPIRAEYSASKFAVSALSEVLRAELAMHGIDVLLVCPGFVATNFVENLVSDTTVRGQSGQRRSKGWEPPRAADAILRAIARGKRELVFPAGIRILLWVNRLFPRLVDFGCAKMSTKNHAAESQLLKGSQEMRSPEGLSAPHSASRSHQLSAKD